MVPTDKQWQPTPEGAAAAVDHVVRLFSGPGDNVWDVKSTFYDQATLIDAGEATTRIVCSNCACDIDMQWFVDLDEQSYE